MKIQRSSLIKWSKITLLCSAYSFFWGAMVHASVLAMVLGLLTLIAMFSLMESHPWYQAQRAGNALLAKALDFGIKIRVFFAIFVVISYGFMLGLSNNSPSRWPLRWLSLPCSGELAIGMVATEATKTLTGVDVTIAQGATIMSSLGHAGATYMATMITGLMHTVILALLCGIIYGVLWIKRRWAR